MNQTTPGTEAGFDLDLDNLEALARAAEQMFTGMLWYTRFQILDGISNDESAAFISALDPETVLALIALARQAAPDSAAQPVQAGEAVDTILAEFDRLSKILKVPGYCAGTKYSRREALAMALASFAPVSAQQTDWLKEELRMTNERIAAAKAQDARQSVNPAAQAVTAPSVASVIASMDRGEDEHDEDPPGIFTKDEVLDMLERDLLTDSGVATLRNGDSLKFPLDELAILANHAAERAVKATASPASTPEASQQPIGQIRRDIERTNVVWFGEIPPHGTNIYAAPTAAAATTSEDARDAARYRAIRRGDVYIEPNNDAGEIYVATDKGIYTRTSDEFDAAIDAAMRATQQESE